MVFSPIHRALGLPSGEMSLTLIEQAIKSRVKESTDLDWKQHLYDPKKPKWDEEAAKNQIIHLDEGSEALYGFTWNLETDQHEAGDDQS